MSNVLQKINIFISSPGDVSDERAIASLVIERLNRLAFVQDRFILRAAAYEDVVPSSVGIPPQQTVDKYMLNAKESDIVICIFWARIASPPQKVKSVR